MRCRRDRGSPSHSLGDITRKSQLKLYAVRIFVRKWEESCDFYRDKVKLPERFRNDDIGWAEYDLGGPCIGVQYVDEEDEEGKDLVGRTVGVSLQVDNIDESYKELKSRGVEFLAPPEKQEWGGTLAFFKDPDGNVLTLIG